MAKTRRAVIGSVAAHSGRTTPSAVVQPYGSLVDVRLGLDQQVRYQSVAALNRMLAHTLALRDLYKKCHWQTSGGTFYQLHLLFDKHYGEQVELADRLAERVQTLGGVAIAMPHDVWQESLISRAPGGREDARAQLHRLLSAHEIIFSEVRALAQKASQHGDPGTEDLLVSEVLRTNELQSWYIGEHLANL